MGLISPHIPTQPSRSLEGRVAVVTGGSRGIGASVAEAMSAAGASVLINHIEPAVKATALLEQIKQAGGHAALFEADVTRPESHTALLEAAESLFGPPDILVNNAAIEARRPAIEVNSEEWDLVMAVNLKAPYFLSTEFARRLIARGLPGTIINLSSTHEDVPMKNNAVYNISKSGLRMLTRSLALEWAPHRITVNSLIPGAVRTDLNRKVLSDPAYEANVRSKIPLGWIAEPSELAAAAVFLASPEARYMTGTSLKLDGGLSIQFWKKWLNPHR